MARDETLGQQRAVLATRAAPKSSGDTFQQTDVFADENRANINVDDVC
jgi:hypothetical protein